MGIFYLPAKREDCKAVLCLPVGGSLLVSSRAKGVGRNWRRDCGILGRPYLILNGNVPRVSVQSPLQDGKSEGV